MQCFYIEIYYPSDLDIKATSPKSDSLLKRSNKLADEVLKEKKTDLEVVNKANK